MPGMATAHSHAFQRLLRGLTQRRQSAAGSFWSWRGLMYRLAEQLGPEDLYHAGRMAYAELAMSGVTAVGEFHYLHHDKNGSPYASRTELADTMIRAARDVGVRISLIRTAYLRGGYRQPVEAAQRRFVDPNVEVVLRDLEDLRTRYARDRSVTIAAAAHSVRAVPLKAIELLAAYARQQDLPFHMHLCEQRRELVEAEAEYGRTPVQLLAENGILSRRFVGIHATHLSPNEIASLGEAEAAVCLCRTTERDLGDGFPETGPLLAAGVRLCVGVDSHAAPDAFEEIRAVELDERTRTESRHAAADAPVLLDMATVQGLIAIGFDPETTESQVFLDARDPGLIGATPKNAADMILFGATPGPLTG